MIIENSDALKNWLTSCLGNLCDADPAALAKYVMALVKKDKPVNELKEFCLDQLEVFLLKETKNFVDLLFETLKNKSYLTNTIISTINTSGINEKIGVSSPSHNENIATSKISHCSVNNETIAESTSGSKIDKTEKKFKDTTNTEPVLKPRRTSFQGSNRTKSRSRSPIRKSSRQRSRSRDNEDKHKKYLSEEEKTKRDFTSKKIDMRKRGFRERRTSTGENRNNRFEKDNETILEKEGPNNRSRSRSNSWDKNRSRSRSWSSHSSSRSRSRSKERSRSGARNNLKSEPKHLSHGDTDYRLNHPNTVRPSNCRNLHINSNHYGGRETKRCQDYDEKGYCMRGDLCLYDHGADPLVFEDIPSVLKFGVTVSQNTSTKNNSSDISGSQAGKNSPSLPPLPPSPPPLPPPPPPLPPTGGAYLPEPYNPEAPGMNITPREHVNSYWTPPNLPVHHPPAHHQPWPPQLSGIPGIVFNINEPPPFHHTKPPRTRELIGVPTLDDSSDSLNPPRNEVKNKENLINTQKKNFRLKPQISSINNDKSSINITYLNDNEKRKGFDFNRLGPRKIIKRNDRCTLEVRKIPKQFNTISMLNSHFSKFGTIVNLQVGYDNDPESALVQFMNHSEANAAYRSTDAVFNNRFIKVFWHNKDNNISAVKENTPTANLSGKDHTNQISEGNVLELSQPDSSKNHLEKLPERAVAFSSKGSLSRTIYNPAALKKNNIASSILSTQRPKELKKDAMRKRLELHKKKQEFLKSQVEHQKIILDKLSNSKNEKERQYLKQTIKEIGSKILILQNDIKKDSENLKKLYKTVSVQHILNKTEAERELLDAEMDLYKKQRTGDDTTELVTKVQELRQKAKAYGLLDNARGRTTRRIRRGTTRFLSRNVLSHPFSSRSIDHRTRKILVVGFSDKDGLTKHFSHFGELESVESNESGIIVIFKTRKEAEAAYSKGTKLGETILSLTWLEDHKSLNLEHHDDFYNAIANVKEEPPPNLEADDDEEDEEDSEARLWRR